MKEESLERKHAKDLTQLQMFLGCDQTEKLIPLNSDSETSDEIFTSFIDHITLRSLTKDYAN